MGSAGGSGGGDTGGGVSGVVSGVVSGGVSGGGAHRWAVVCSRVAGTSWRPLLIAPSKAHIGRHVHVGALVRAHTLGFDARINPA